MDATGTQLRRISPPTVLNGTGAFANTSLRASFYLQTLIPTTGQAILQHDKEVTGVANHLGSGQTILLGTFTGLCATAHHHPESDQLIARLLSDAGVQPDRIGPLLRRRRVLDTQEAWFLINPTSSEITQKIDLAGFNHAREVLGTPLTIQPDHTVTVTIPAANIACLLLS